MPNWPVQDGTNTTLQNDSIIFNNPYEPLKNITQSIKTVTRSIKGIQQTFRREGERLLSRDSSVKWCAVG